MIEKDDWRLMGQERYLKDRKLFLISYVCPSETWDHDHCEFCCEKFSRYDGDLHEGYTTEDRRFWICPECYEDFKEMFNWEHIVPE